MTTEIPTFDEWAVLELFGHRKLAGKVSQAAFPPGFVRLDIPRAGTVDRDSGERIHPESWTATQLYSPSAIYSITPVSEAVARAYAEGHQAAPVQRWEVPQLVQRTREEQDFAGAVDLVVEEHPDEVELEPCTCTAAELEEGIRRNPLTAPVLVEEAREKLGDWHANGCPMETPF